MKCNSRDRRSASAKKRAERAGLLGGRDDAWKKGNQFCAKGLVKMIGKNAPQFLVILGYESRCKCARIRTILDCRSV